MKSLMRFIVTLIVIAVVAFVVGFLVMNSKVNEQDSIINGNEGNVLDIGSGENQLEEEKVPKELSKEEIISEIEKQITSIGYNSIINEFDEKITEKEASASIKDFMNYFNVKDILAKVRVKNGCIEIIPYSDFVENMEYYYDGAGNLILFESVSTTVGGSCKYYFKDGKLIDIKIQYDEEVDVKLEDASDILNRAKIIYENFGKRPAVIDTASGENELEEVSSGEQEILEKSGE